ncbi:DoxX family protein [[Mycobacterium] kokjensenii]|uniref:DoxX family protein n=1 Tax=[Mycobacterium] kokjensenii TaxID=3064287 RepID=A0ABM9LLQ3_9MYCO|nr:DoxX family protein [Mycolicibacter sp. MU0083]CAJ1501039.1 DoxX family protein [Mycolicibacter sp. MU0083]
MQRETGGRSRSWIVGAAITVLVDLFFAVDAVPKILGMTFAREGIEGLGFSPDKTAVIGWVLLACLVVFAIPRTAVLGALGLTAYLGGAATINLHGDAASVGPLSFAVCVGLLLWTGLILRRPELLRVLGIRRD